MKGVSVVVLQVGAHGNPCEVAPEGLAAHRLGNPDVDAGGVVVVSGVRAGAAGVVQVQMMNQLGGAKSVCNEDISSRHP